MVIDVVRFYDLLHLSFRGTMRLKSALVGVALLTTVAAGGSAAAGGWSQPRSKTVRVRFQPTGVVSNDLGHVCDSGGVQCVYSSSETNATQTGDLQGSTVQADVTSTGSSTRLTGLSKGTFTGSVTGCGTGGFLYSATSTIDLVADTDDTTYVIDLGSGTGDLTGISGVLVQHSTFSGTEASPISGVLRCTVGR